MDLEVFDTSFNLLTTVECCRVVVAFQVVKRPPSWQPQQIQCPLMIYLLPSLLHELWFDMFDKCPSTLGTSQSRPCYLRSGENMAVLELETGSSSVTFANKHAQIFHALVYRIA